MSNGHSMCPSQGSSGICSGMSQPSAGRCNLAFVDPTADCLDSESFSSAATTPQPAGVGLSAPSNDHEFFNGF